MSDRDVLEFLAQTLYNKWLDKMFVFTINKKRVTSTQFFNYQRGLAFVDNKTLVDKARETRLNVSHETLKGVPYASRI